MTTTMCRAQQRHGAFCKHGIRAGECFLCPRPTIQEPEPDQESESATADGNLRRALPGRTVHPSSHAGKLMAAARRFQGRDFTLAQLAVEVWLQHPQDFGLEGYETAHPDNNKVSAALSGGRGLVARGLLVKLSPKVYRVA